jgi:hypothetical protein
LVKGSRNAMKKQALKNGQIVQLNPETVGNQMFAACLMTVTEPKEWGGVGYVQTLGENGNLGGRAFYRAMWHEMELTGGGVAR